MKYHIGGPFRGWRSRGHGKHAAARTSSPPPPLDDQTSSRETVANGMQLAIGLLTASLDSPELEAWALPILIPADADGIGDLMVGLHLISELVIHELHEATGEPPEAILQRLAILAEHRRGLPSTG
jgi:hypothetical protein